MEEWLRRNQEGQGLTRPELAILLSTAKLTLQDAIERHRDIAADPTMIDELAASFPPAMQKSHAQAIQDHQLRGEIIATRSEEHTSELPSLMRISYAVFCLKNIKTYT